MPQFDFTTYSSQIFWFALCFLALYFTIHFVVLPRIRKIINDRHEAIHADLNSAYKLEEKLGDIEIKTENLRRQATQEYLLKLDEAAKSASSKREELLEELKAKIEKITEKSNEDLKNFINSSKVKSQEAANDLVKSIKNKIFSA